MANDYYQEGEQLEQQLDEEASFYFMLNDLDHWVEKDGVDFIIKRMRNSTFEKFADWFYSNSEQRRTEVCELLRKK